MAPRPDRRDEAGATLIELLIAVAILGIAVVVIVGGMATSIIASDHHRKVADANSIVVSAAEQVKSKSTPHVRCATPASYLTAARGVSLPAGWTADTITIPSVWWYDGETFRDPSDPAFGGVCPENGADSFPLALQLVTIQVKSLDDRATHRLSVVKGG